MANDSYNYRYLKTHTAYLTNHTLRIRRRYLMDGCLISFSNCIASYYRDRHQVLALASVLGHMLVLRLVLRMVLRMVLKISLMRLLAKFLRHGTIIS
jgi:hypothetical protein